MDMTDRWTNKQKKNHEGGGGGTRGTAPVDT